MPSSPSRRRTSTSSVATRATKPAPKRRERTCSIGAGESPVVMIRRSEIHGRGLFAVEAIPRGTLIGTYEGPETQRNGAYVLWCDEEGREFGIAGKNDLRFTNHSKRPNAIFRGDELWALRRIQPEEEITFDYGEDWD